MISRLSLALVAILSANAIIVNAFYLPGLAPKAFCKENKASETCKVTFNEIYKFIKANTHA